MVAFARHTAFGAWRLKSTREGVVLFPPPSTRAEAVQVPSPTDARLGRVAPRRVICPWAILRPTSVEIVPSPALSPSGSPSPKATSLCNMARVMLRAAPRRAATTLLGKRTARPTTARVVGVTPLFLVLTHIAISKIPTRPNPAFVAHVAIPAILAPPAKALTDVGVAETARAVLSPNAFPVLRLPGRATTEARIAGQVPPTAVAGTPTTDVTRAAPKLGIRAIIRRADGRTSHTLAARAVGAPPMAPPHAPLTATVMEGTADEV